MVCISIWYTPLYEPYIHLNPNQIYTATLYDKGQVMCFVMLSSFFYDVEGKKPL